MPFKVIQGHQLEQVKSAYATSLFGGGKFGPKFQTEGAFPTNHYSCRKTNWMFSLQPVKTSH